MKQQLNFLDTAQTYQPPAKALARASDPAPSHEAAEQMVSSGSAQSDCERILAVLKEARNHLRGPRGSLTAKEIATFAGWLLGSQPNNVRVSRRMASLTAPLIDKETKIVTRPIMVIATGVRKTFDRSDEAAITSYALLATCCGTVAHWQRASLGNGKETRTCGVCGEALGIGSVHE
jgi:hypothetical protein